MASPSPPVGTGDDDGLVLGQSARIQPMQAIKKIGGGLVQIS